MKDPADDTGPEELEPSAEEISPAPPSAGPPAPWHERPGIDDFERWLQKHILVKLGGVIVIAFLFKSFVPIQLGFTAGLLTGVILLALIYLAGFYRRK